MSFFLSELNFFLVRSHLTKCLLSWKKTSGPPQEQGIQSDNNRDQQDLELLNGNDPPGPDHEEQNPEMNGTTKIVGPRLSPKHVVEKLAKL